jgi:hypothetical protein
MRKKIRKLFRHHCLDCLIRVNNLRAYPKINFMACESHALKHRDDFHCAFFGILGYALSVNPNQLRAPEKTGAE